MQKYSFTLLIPIIGFFLSVFFTSKSFSIVNKLALKYRLIDKPNNRKLHNYPKARIGGITIIFGFIFSFIFSYLLAYFLTPFREDLFFNISQISLIIIGSLVMFFIGLTDDLRGLTPWSRLIGQIAISSILFSKGLALNEINFTSIGFSDFSIILNPLFSYLLTVIWLVGITNAFNWIDGLDGLAAGIAGITSIIFVIIFYQVEIFGIVLFSSILLGTCIGFLKNNSYPAKIFMGDGGSYFLGFSLGAISIYKDNSDLNNPIFITALISLFLPLFDMASVIFRRLIKGRSPFYPDKSHFHHYLLDIGFEHKETVRILHLISMLFSIFSLFTLKNINL